MSYNNNNNNNNNNKSNSNDNNTLRPNNEPRFQVGLNWIP